MISHLGDETTRILEYGEGYSFSKTDLNEQIQAAEVAFHRGCKGEIHFRLSFPETTPAGFIATVSPADTEKIKDGPTSGSFSLDFGRRQDSFFAKILNDRTKHNSPQVFIDQDNSLFIFNNIKTEGFHDLHFRKESSIPLTLNLLTYPQIPQISAFSTLQLQKSGSSWKCKGCKIAIKALAATIFFALLKAALPAAVIAAVASFLGLTKELAEEFICNLGGYSIDEIAELLCKKIGLCP